MVGNVFGNTFWKTCQYRESLHELESVGEDHTPLLFFDILPVAVCCVGHGTLLPASCLICPKWSKQRPGQIDASVSSQYLNWLTVAEAFWQAGADTSSVAP
jgi:hypothetical protein